MSLRRLLPFFLAALTLCASATTTSMSFANGRFPATGQIVISPSDPNLLITRATYGFLISKDRGANWDWICELSVGFSGPEDPMLALLAQNNIAATLANGLVVSRDVGCSWNFAATPVPRDLFIDIASRRSDPRTAFAVTSKYAGDSNDAGQLLFRSELFATNDGGVTWTKVGAPFDPTLLLETVDVSDSNPQRIYVTAIRGSGPDLQGFLLVSDDGGRTWTSRNVPLNLAEERAPFIGALSPTQPDTLYVRTSASPGKPNRLLVSTDAGRTWQAKHQTTGAMLGLALSADGSKIYLGGQEDGLWSASTTDFAFTKKSNVQVQCLTVGAGGIWACSNEVTGFVVGFSKDEGTTFEPRLRLSTLRGPLACAAGSPTHDQCESDWPRQRAELGIVVDGGAADAGRVDAGAGALPGAGAASDKKCGCGVHDGPTSFGAVVIALLTWVKLRSRPSRGSR